MTRNLKQFQIGKSFDIFKLILRIAITFRQNYYKPIQFCAACRSRMKATVIILQLLLKIDDAVDKIPFDLNSILQDFLNDLKHNNSNC